MKLWLVVLLSISSVLGQALDNHEVLDANGTYNIYWSVEGSSVTFELAVLNHGYAGFGFSPDGGMKNSDVVLAWVDASGTHFTDRYAVAHDEPLVDDIQNYNLISSSENATHTVVRFSRLIDTGDTAQDRVIENGPINLIYSFHPVDPVEGKPITWHGSTNRGTKLVAIIP